MRWIYAGSVIAFMTGEMSGVDWARGRGYKAYNLHTNNVGSELKRSSRNVRRQTKAEREAEPLMDKSGRTHQTSP